MFYLIFSSFIRFYEVYRVSTMFYLVLPDIFRVLSNLIRFETFPFLLLIHYRVMSFYQVDRGCTMSYLVVPVFSEVLSPFAEPSSIRFFHVYWVCIMFYLVLPVISQVSSSPIRFDPFLFSFLIRYRFISRFSKLIEVVPCFA